jgi:hypothetical protein
MRRALSMLSATLLPGPCRASSSLLLGVVLAGCAGGTETGNPSLTGQLSYTGISSAPASIGVRGGGAVANVQNAWFGLGQVTVSSSGDCGLNRNRTFSVPALGIGDHAAGAHNATEFEGAAGAFCSVELPFQSVAADDTKSPAELRGHGIVVAGELADGTPFLLRSDAAPIVRLQGEANGFEFSAQDPNVLIAFDFATWLQGVDWAAASVDAGRINVDAGSNTDILRSFESQLASGVALYRDVDGDGVLDDLPVLLAHAR